MQTCLEDRLAIAELMTGWMHRDLAEWDELRELFHPDATIEVTWFEGRFSDFVDRSIGMGKSDLNTKHFISSPMVTFNGDKAIAETNAVIIGDNASLDLGCSAHNRFYDMIEKRGAGWKIVRRQSIYDTGYFNFPHGIVEIDQAAARSYPREYAPLAYLLEKSGFPVRRVFATKGSDLEKTMKADGKKWLAA